MKMFSYEPTPIQYLDYPNIKDKIRNKVGDIRQPWSEIGKELDISAFAAKSLFVLGMMRWYVLSANAILKELNYLGFLSACGLLGSGVELLGRCIHEEKKVRQNPIGDSMKRLEAGFKYISRSHLPPDVVVETNHYPKEIDGYSVEDLKNLRNLALHGGCIAKTSEIKGDIELLHELRKAFYGIPRGECDPHEGKGPIQGAIDRYYEKLSSGDKKCCDHLATAGVSPAPVRFQEGAMPLDKEVVRKMKEHIEENQKRFPIEENQKPFPIISGGHIKDRDFFQLYP